jgi:hypothetical protein
MGFTRLLIQDLANQKHPLGRAIQIEEVDILVESLRDRFGVSIDELDLSPESLKRLESHLRKYYRATEGQGHSLSDEQLARLVREIGAYLGQVLIRHAKGSWFDKATTLDSTGVSIDGPWQVQKDGRKKNTHNPTVFVVGSAGAFAWDALADGKSFDFYREYREAISKAIIERLS